MIEKKHLLTSKQMARFVTDGYLRFDEIVPPEINAAALKEYEEKPWPHGGGYVGEPLSNKWQGSPGIGAMLELPQVRGILHSLVGPNPRYDHHQVHVMPANSPWTQSWHADAIIDLRTHFDIQFFYFAHDVPKEMGGTTILPGSHFRVINESDIARYRHFVGELQTVAKAGTMIFVHHGIWHRAAPNVTPNPRYMFKLRLNPTVRQLRLWNTDDIDDPEIGRILHGNHGWYGGYGEDRLEVVNRIKLWRFLTGNEKYDTGYWMGRLEARPENVLQPA